MRLECGLHDVRTWLDTRLLVERATGQVRHGTPAPPRFPALLAWLPAGRPNTCFLIPATAVPRPLNLDEDHAPAPVISLRVAQVDDAVVFSHPLTGWFLSAEAFEGEAVERGRVAIDRTEIAAWERFRLTPTKEFSPDAQGVVSRLESMLTATRTAPEALQYLLTSQPARGWLPAVLRLLQPAELAWLGRALGRSRQAADAFAALFEDDMWAQEALPALATMPETMQPPPAFARSIAPSILNWAGIHGKYISVAQMCNAFARRDRAPTRDLCLVTTVRNEGLYLLEWIAHHQALGVQAFFIYSNDNDDGSDALLAALARAGVINWIRNQTSLWGSAQHQAYGHAFQILPEILCYRWAGVIDVDEFIMLDHEQFESIPTFIAACETRKTDAIALSWLLFGSDGQIRRRPEPVTRRFFQRDPAVDPHVKSLFRPASFMHAHCHYPIWDDYTAWTFRTATGELQPQSRAQDAAAFSPRPTDTNAWINHYYTKSAEEYVLRRTTGPGDTNLTLAPSGAFLDSSYARMFVRLSTAKALLTDRRALQCVPGLEAEIAALACLPGVADAMVIIEQSYPKRLRVAASVLESDPRFQAPGTIERWFADLMRPSLPKRTQ